MTRRLFVLLTLVAVGCAEEPTRAATQSEAVAVEAPIAATWPDVVRTARWVELRAGDSRSWIVLRRLHGSSWVRGYAYGGGGPARVGRLQRPLALVEQGAPGSPFRRFWLHAQALQDLTEGGRSPSVSGHRVAAGRLQRFLEGTTDEADGTLFEHLEAPWGEYAVSVKSTRPGGPGAYCEVRVAFPAGADHTLIGVRQHVGGTGGNALFARCPGEPGWLEVAGRRIDLPQEGAGFYRSGAFRSRVYPSCPSRVPASELLRHAGRRRLQLCDASCCYEATDAFREELQSATSRQQALAEFVARRPPSSAFRPAPRGPNAPTPREGSAP